MRILHSSIILFIITLGSRAFAAGIEPLVRATMESEHELSSVLFTDVVRAATGKKIVPITMSNAVDAALLAKIGKALDMVLAKMNAANNPAQSKRRINEVSALFESAIKTELNAIDGFDCDFPKTASGTHQRSGYPDLRIFDRTSRRVVYLDPKLFERGSHASSLRTFYYEPKRDTNKIMDDAHHLIVAVEHDGKQNGAWKFLSWKLVDLSQFRVRLKAEFQGSNRDMYRPEAVVALSRTNLNAEAQRR